MEQVYNTCKQTMQSGSTKVPSAIHNGFFIVYYRGVKVLFTVWLCIVAQTKIALIHKYFCAIYAKLLSVWF